MKKNAIKVIYSIIIIVCAFFVTWGCARFIYLLDLKCLWHEVFGMYCAGCGVTRMILATANLDFYQAFRYNPVFFILFITSFVYVIYFLWCKIFKIKVKYKISIKVIFFIAGLLVVFMVLRNVPAFYYLSPMEV